MHVETEPMRDCRHRWSKETHNREKNFHVEENHQFFSRRSMIIKKNERERERTRERENNHFLCSCLIVFLLKMFPTTNRHAHARTAPTVHLRREKNLFSSSNKLISLPLDFRRSNWTNDDKMVKFIEGTIDYEKQAEVLNDNHKVLIFLDDLTLTGEDASLSFGSTRIFVFALRRYRFARWFQCSEISHDREINLRKSSSNVSHLFHLGVRRERRGEKLQLCVTRTHRGRWSNSFHHQFERSRSDQRLRRHRANQSGKDRSDVKNFITNEHFFFFSRRKLKLKIFSLSVSCVQRKKETNRIKIFDPVKWDSFDHLEKKNIAQRIYVLRCNSWLMSASRSNAKLCFRLEVDGGWGKPRRFFTAS